MKFMEKMRQSFAGGASVAHQEQKASATAGLAPGHLGGSSAWLSLGAPSWGPRSYAGLTQAGYVQNVVAHRAVKLVAECAASVPVIALQNGRRVERHPLLFLLQQPNPMMGVQDLLEQIYTHLLLAGNAYVERVDGPSGRAVELYALRPDRMRAITRAARSGKWASSRAEEQLRKSPVPRSSKKTSACLLRVFPRGGRAAGG